MKHYEATLQNHSNNPQTINVGSQRYHNSISGLSYQVGDKQVFVSYQDQES